MLKAQEVYETLHGYLAGRDMKLVVMHAEYGEVARSMCSIELLRDMRGC